MIVYNDLSTDDMNELVLECIECNKKGLKPRKVVGARACAVKSAPEMGLSLHE